MVQFIGGGTLSVASIGNSGAISPLGTSGTINFSSSSNPGGTLKYTGTGETSNKVISFSNGPTGGGTLDQSGTGLLKFTSNLAGGSLLNANHTLTLQGSTSGTGELSGVISDPGSSDTLAVTKSGTGTWTLSGANTYSGGTSLTAGSLLLASNGVVGAGGSITSGPVGTGTLTITGGTLSSDSTAARTIQNSLVLGTVTLGDATKNGTLTFNSTDGSNTLTTPATITINTDVPTWTINSPVVIADVISSPFLIHLTLAGSSTLTLSAAATYMGNTTISSGATLQLGAANVIPQVASTSFVTLDGTLDLNTFNQTIKNLNGGGTIDTAAGGTPILTIAGRTGPGLFNGVIQNTAGTLSLNVTGLLAAH